MKTAMITADENGIPQETLAAIRNAGIEITCRKCLTEAELIEFAADADVLWMFGPNPALTAGALDHLPKCKALFRSGSGVDALPLKRAAELGIEVHNTPESIAESGCGTCGQPAVRNGAHNRGRRPERPGAANGSTGSTACAGI